MNRTASGFSRDDCDTAKAVFCYQVSNRREPRYRGTGHPCPLERGRESGGPSTVLGKHQETIGEQRLVEVIVTPPWESRGGFEGTIELVHVIVERTSPAESLDQRMPTAADSRNQPERSRFKIIKPFEGLLSRQPPEP